MKTFLCIMALLGGFLAYDYWKYTRLPLKIIHIDYTIYSLSGPHRYIENLRMKGNQFYVERCGTATDPWESIYGSGCTFLWWGEQTKTICSGFGKELVVNSFYIKNEKTLEIPK